MKKMIFVLFLLPVIVYAQNDTALSDIEKFSMRSGVLMKRDFIDISNVRIKAGENIKVEIAVYTDLLYSDSVKGLRLEYKNPNTEQIAVLAVSEVDGVINLMKTLPKLITKNPDHYTEIEYTSRNGFRIGCYSTPEGWQGYMYVNKYSILITQEDFDKLFSLFTSGKDRL